jgi:hypothetical protein
MSDKNLLSYLLNRGDYVELAQGRIVIKPASGKSVPEGWLKANRIQLLTELAQLTDMQILVYDRYSTGRYPHPGVTLFFISLLNDQDYRTIFNADLSRQRNGLKGKKGDNLPKQKFNCGARSNLWKFWKKSGLEMPRQRSELHSKLHQLENVAMCAIDSDHTGLIQNSDLLPLDFEFEAIQRALNVDVKGPLARCESLVNGSLAEHVKHSPQNQNPSTLQPIQTTCHPNYATSKQEGEYQVIFNKTSKTRVEEQSNNEWVEEYSRKDRY